MCIFFGPLFNEKFSFGIQSGECMPKWTEHLKYIFMLFFLGLFVCVAIAMPSFVSLKFGVSILCLCVCVLFQCFRYHIVGCASTLYMSSYFHFYSHSYTYYSFQLNYYDAAVRCTFFFQHFVLFFINCIAVWFNEFSHYRLLIFSFQSSKRYGLEF